MSGISPKKNRKRLISHPVGKVRRHKQTPVENQRTAKAKEQPEICICQEPDAPNHRRRRVMFFVSCIIAFVVIVLFLIRFAPYEQEPNIFSFLGRGTSGAILFAPLYDPPSNSHLAWKYFLAEWVCGFLLIALPITLQGRLIGKT